MKVIFRVDAYPEIGLGHFVRSIAIALELQKTSKLNIVFAGNYSDYALNELNHNNLSYLSPGLNENEEDFLFRFIASEKPKLIFIDNLYNYSDSFLHSIKSKVKLILFHNLCEGRFQVDAFVLPSAHHPEEIIHDTRWEKNNVDFYYGFDYIPVNEEIKNIQLKNSQKSSRYKVSITTGGSDPRGVMIKVIKWLLRPGYSKIKFTILPGGNFILAQELEALKQKAPGNFDFNTFNYYDLESSDLVICTFGVTSYELIYLGVPFISISHAQSNARGSSILSEKMPFIKDLGLIDNLREETFHKQLKESISNRDLKTEFRKSSRNLMDGKGINRIIDIILNQLNKS